MTPHDVHRTQCTSASGCKKPTSSLVCLLHACVPYSAMVVLMVFTGAYRSSKLPTGNLMKSQAEACNLCSRLHDDLQSLCNASTCAILVPTLEGSNRTYTIVVAAAGLFRSGVAEKQLLPECHNSGFGVTARVCPVHAHKPGAAADSWLQGCQCQCRFGVLGAVHVAVEAAFEHTRVRSTFL